MLSSEKKVWVDGTEFERYVIKDLVLDLHDSKVSMVVHYFDEDTSRTYIKKHFFIIEGHEIDVNDLIKKTHKVHE